jgi:hypothetical protein
VPGTAEEAPARRVARTLAELGDEPSIDADLHLEARRVLNRNPEPRNPRDVTVALESMGYSESRARALGFGSVFELAAAVFDLAYLYYLPGEVETEPPGNTWRTYLSDYAAGSWYGMAWIISVFVLFVGRVALWSSLESTPRVSTVVSLAFFLAVTLGGATSQLLARKGSFYFLQGNYALVRWTVVRVLVYGAAAAILAVAFVYTVYIVPTYGERLGATFAEYALAIYAFLVSAAPLYILRRYGTLTVATMMALAVTLLAAHFVTGTPAGVHRAQLLGLALGSGAMVVLTVSTMTVWARTVDRDSAHRHVKPPALRVVFWIGSPYAVYGLAYFVLILGPTFVAGLAYGQLLKVHQYVYPATVASSIDLALLELVVLLGLIHASIERFGRRLRPLLAGYRLDQWSEARRSIRREWWTSLLLVSAASAVMAWVAPTVLLHALPRAVTAAVRLPGGVDALHVAVVGFSFVPVGMLCSQYLFFLSRPGGAVIGMVAGASVGVTMSAILVSGGDIALAPWGLVAGGFVYAAVTALVSHGALATGDETLYASF